MKKLLLVFLLIFSLGALTSCGEPDDPKPNPPIDDPNQGNDDPEPVNYVITLSVDSVTLNVGEEKQINASVSPETSLVWSSNDNNIATCENGLIKAIKAGSTKIVVSTSGGEAKKEISVKVNEVVEEDNVQKLNSLLLNVLDKYFKSNEFNVYIEVKNGSSTSTFEMIYNKNSDGLYDEFFYQIRGNIELLVYISDGISYMKEETSMKKTSLTDSEARTIIKDYNGEKFLEKVTSFYNEASFYSSLEEVSENKFKLNLEKYEGRALNVDGISEVVLNVTLNGSDLSTIELVYSNGNSVKVSYRGYSNITVPQPNDLDKYTE